jgi:hypothetical protein
MDAKTTTKKMKTIVPNCFRSKRRSRRSDCCLLRRWNFRVHRPRSEVLGVGRCCCVLAE